MCQEVTTVCNQLHHTFLIDASTAPVFPTASALPMSDCTINALSTSMPDPFQPIIMAAMIVEGRYICQFEIDTDASHTVVSPEVYQKAYLVATNKPKRGPLTPMKLADESHSQKTLFSTHLSLARADNPSRTRTFEVMVLEGPSVILGRTAIKYFWLKIYNDLLTSVGSTRKAASFIQFHHKVVLENMLLTSVPKTNVKTQSTSIAPDASSASTDVDAQVM